MLLSTALPGCGHRVADTPPPALVPDPIAIEVKSTPPAELLRCAERPEGLPEDPALIAQIPTAIRAGIIRMARAFGANASQLDRLIDWNAPGSCIAAKAK